MSQPKVIDTWTRATGYDFLSPWFPCSIYIGGKQYKTCEHAHQAFKTLVESEHELVRKAPTPQVAKKLGRSLTIRPDWELVKDALMSDHHRLKFQNPFLADLLLKTGDARLVFGNTWNDTYWGVCRGVGTNKLGLILEEIREELSRVKT